MQILQLYSFPPALLPVLGSLEWYVMPTLDAALLLILTTIISSEIWLAKFYHFDAILDRDWACYEIDFSFFGLNELWSLEIYLIIDFTHQFIDS